MKRSRLFLLAVIVLLAPGCAVFDIEGAQRKVDQARADLAVQQARVEEANRNMLAVYLRQAEEAEAKGQDGNAIRQKCEDTFKLLADRYRAGTADIRMRNMEARIGIDMDYNRLLSYIPRCWR